MNRFEIGKQACSVYRMVTGRCKIENVTAFQVELAKEYYEAKKENHDNRKLQ